MHDLFLRFAKDDHGSPSAEMALVLPILFAVLFGAFELGNYFLTEHKVVKAVRDGARYAARRPFTDYAGCTPSGDLITATQNVTRTGQIADGGISRVSGSWTINVTATCDTSNYYEGVYVTSLEGTPVVTVAATVPYTSLLGQIGLADVTLALNARSQAAVTGI